MRRIIGITLVIIAAFVLVAFAGFGGSDDSYKVRAIFDNADFVVPGEEVKVAGAVAGLVDSVDVTMPGQVVTADGKDDPGKAVVVMDITEPGFDNFRTDASCLIRPQSLIGEKFIECTPTQPRASGTPPPPELSQIPAGQDGAGEHLLPVEQNGKAVDLDLVQNIMRRPYADRFRLILNELGAGLAARGDDLAAIVDRANPALRQTDRVLAILASQNQQLASLAENSDTALGPLARERAHITGFFRNANTTNEAVLERQPQFEEGLQKLPSALKNVRTTMASLTDLSDQGTPLFTDLNAEAKSLSKATIKLGPFADAGVPALTTLGDAVETAGPKLVAADPVIQQTATLGNASTPVATNLSALLTNFDKTKGFNYLTDFIFNTVGSENGYDQYGHFLRANLQVTACLDYQTIVQSGCESFFQPSTATTKKKCKKPKKLDKKTNKCKKPKKKFLIPPTGTGPRVPGSGAAAVDATGETAPSGVEASPTIQQGAQILGFLFGDGSGQQPPQSGDSP